MDARIAIIGMAGRFPGAADVAAFWANLCAGVESIHCFSDAELRAAGVDAATLADPHYVKAGAPLDGIEWFDAEFFGFSPREAEITDPQQRLFLECAWEALEHAGYDPKAGGVRTGVYAGTGMSSYLLANLLENKEFLRKADYLQVLLGNNKDAMPTRVSYKLDLRGPSLNVSTACSTGLVTVHLACQALLDQQCDLALAGGSSVQLPQDQGYAYVEGSIASPDGHCRAFDARAQGTVAGNGVGVVVLKRLDDAVNDGDTIYAVIAGSAINNDGADKVGYTAPSVRGQTEVIAEALALADAEPDTIGYVEAHGTGTALGDPIEVTALTRAFASARHGYCALGSVKTNIGHLDEAAGVAGLIKAALAVYHGQIPPSLHYQQPNPQIDFARSPFFVNTTLRDWPLPGVRRAGVSSFGIGGTNAHAVLEQAPDLPEPTAGTAGRPWQVLRVSARSPAALTAACERLDRHLTGGDSALADVAYTLDIGRQSFSQRAVRLVGPSEIVGNWLTGQAAASPPKLAFMFPGQGSQQAGMGAVLYAREPVFRAEVDRCAIRLQPLLGQDIRDWLLASPDDAAATTALRQTAAAQPTLFVMEYALAQLWRSWGIQPSAVLGHSLGEYVAACLAGVFSLDDALRLIAVRGQLMQTTAAGAMLAVSLSETDLADWLSAAPDLALAAVNGPRQCVVAGPADAIATLHERLSAAGHSARPLATAQAFHSRLMDPILSAFAAEVRRCPLHPPRLPCLSNLTGTWLSAEQATDPDYWVQHLRHTVRFADNLSTVLADAQTLLLEIGPGQTLSSLAGARALPSLPRSQPDAQAGLLNTLGRLWLAGIASDPAGFYADQPRRRVPLPTYPFERQRYWIEPARPADYVLRHTTAAPPPAPVDALADWFYRPDWQPLPAAPAVAPSGSWLLFIDNDGVGATLAAQLRDAGCTVVCVSAGTGFVRDDARHYRIDPAQAEDYAALCAALDSLPEQVVHLWNVSPTASRDQGFYSLLYLARALGSVADRAVTVTVLGSGLHALTAAEPSPDPERALLLGPVRVIPLEYPLLNCRSIDLPAPVDAAALLAVCTRPQDGNTLAWRDGQLWAQGVAPLALPPLAEPLRLRREGVYLITGGYGSMGLAFAEHLQQRVAARVALVGRQLPPSDPVEAVTYLEAALQETLALPGLAGWPGLEQRLNTYCAALVGDYFRACGIALPGSYRREQLEQHLALLPKFSQVLDFCLRLLAQEGYVTLDGPLIAGQRELPTAAALLPTLRADYPAFAGLLTLLTYCGEHYRAAFSGDCDAIQVLYPDGSPAMLEDCDAHTAEYAEDRLYLRLAAQLVAGLCQEAPRRRILEVGGGTGTLSHYVLEALGPEPAAEYHFTDLGQSFVLRARREAEQRGLHHVHCQTLDISADPLAQGYTAASYDLLLAYNVVHATPDLTVTLNHLHSLLRPGGWLLLVETVRPLPWLDLVWGLAEGWWQFSDGYRDNATPLLGLETWERVLGENGFVDVAGFPQAAEQRRHSAGGLLIARRTGPTDLDLRAALPPRIRDRRARLDALQAGGDVLPLAADLTDPAQLTAALASVRARYGTIHGVIHTAGVLGQHLIHNHSREQAEAVFAPKLAAAQQLVRALQNSTPLPDFLVLCSSLSAVRPIPGQVAYCAANAALDTLADAACRAGLPTVAIDWGFWQELGMIEQAVTTTAAKQAILDDIARRGLGTAGVEVLERIIAHAAGPQVLVAAGGELAAPDRRLLTSLNPQRDWLVHEHRVAGRATLPGTAYLQLAACAYRADRNEPTLALELRDVYFLTPLQCDDDEQREVQTVIGEENGVCTFRVLSRAGAEDWLEHARGDIHPLSEPAPPRQPPARLLTAYPEQVPPPQAAAAGFGPHWDCFESVQFAADGNGLAVLALPAAYAGELAAHPLHPALLDMATGFMTLKHAESALLPFSYRRVVIRGPLPARLYSLAERQPSLSGQLTLAVRLLDEQGTEWLRADGYSLRAVPAALVTAPSSADPAPALARGLRLGQPGVLSSLALHPRPRLQPGPGEVELRVHAAGLNFIEVLSALGMLPSGEQPLHYGLECAATISAVGPGVTDWQVGEEVIAYTDGCFGDYTLASTATLARRPPLLSREQAATVAAAYTTAWRALIDRADLQAGERVLIHAATGGLGLAAVHIARMQGAEIYATAGSEEKRAYLRSLGITHVFDSRSLAFADGVLAASGGRGVNVVLNSLGGEFIGQSLNVLAPHGRFIEVGKRDLLKNTQLDLGPFIRNLTFSVIDVGPAMPGFARTWAAVRARLESGALPPLPYRVFPLDAAAEAFGFMAQARHIGKIVLAVSDEAAAAAATPVTPASTAQHGRPLLSTSYAAPRNPVEQQLVSLWQDLLGSDGIGIDDDFFELKGDSLLAAQVVSRLYALFGVRLPLSTLFEAPTVALLAARVARLQTPAAALDDDEEEGTL